MPRFVLWFSLLTLGASATACGSNEGQGATSSAGAAHAGGTGGAQSGTGGSSAGGSGTSGSTSAGSGGAAGSPSAGGSGGSTSAGAAGVSGSGGEVVLGSTPGNYQGTCDGSFGVAIDATYFLDGNDEDQVLRVYRRGADATPVQTKDLSSDLGLGSSDEVDLEDATRVGDRVYVVSSHGRDKDGNLERMRYRFFALDLSGTVPNLGIAVAGYSTTLLDEMLDSANWQTPDSAVIASLTESSQLDVSTDSDLAPKVNGTNIEGLSWLPSADHPNQLLIGFRNPAQASDAIVVSLLNADEVVSGGTPSFGEAVLLDLDGLAIRGMAWSPVHGAVFVLAGPRQTSTSPFRLFEWSGVASEAPVAVQDITPPSDSGVEAIVPWPGSHDVEILFDQGEHDIDGEICKDSDAASQFFSDVIVHVP